MNKTLAALLAASVTSLCAVAYADDAASAPEPAQHMTKHQAGKQADAQYKSDVKSAEGRHALAKANCGSSLTATGRSCKDEVGAEERKEKADAKLKQVDTKAGN
jgi:hypothetical protein